MKVKIECTMHDYTTKIIVDAPNELVAERISLGEYAKRYGKNSKVTSFRRLSEDDIIKMDLLPCPFCGEVDINFYHNGNSHYAFCSFCEAQTKDFSAVTDRKIVIKHWNRRAINE